MVLSVNERFELIKRNTEEIIGEEELKKVLSSKKKPVVYWGTAITGTPHIGYFFPILKLGDFLKAGFEVIILLADLHGALDNTPWDILEKRYNYYKAVIPLMFVAIGISTKNLKFIKGSDFQLEKKYVFDVLKMSTIASQNDCRRAASEVVKFEDNPKTGGLIYPIMQALDEVYLNADIQFAGIDQRKIMVFAREFLPKIGYKPRIEIMVPIIPGLIGKKMSASDEKSKIDLLDFEEAVKAKIKNAECAAGNPDNAVMLFLKYVLMTIKSDKKEKFVVKRDKKYGGELKYSNHGEIEKDFVNKKIHPLDLKNAVAEEISKMLKPIQKHRKELEILAKRAYEN